MDTEATISRAGSLRKTLKFDYTEEDGTNVGSREVEPYSFRIKGGTRLFFGYDIGKGAIRAFKPAMIHSITITENSYSPRWPVEV